MDPGDFNRRFMLQRRETTRDAVGGSVTTWIDELPVWGSAMALSGRELIVAQQKHAETTMRFRIRYRPDLSTEWRLIWERRPYDILDIIDIDQHRYLDLECQTGVRNG